MATVLAVALTALLFILCSLREPTAGDRTPRQLAAAARRTGILRCGGRAAWAVLVVALLTLAAAGALSARAGLAAATVLWMVAGGLAELGGRPAEVGAA
jgi:hypothetical protein